MDKEKLKQASEKLRVIENLESLMQKLNCISKKQQVATRHSICGQAIKWLFLKSLNRCLMLFSEITTGENLKKQRKSLRKCKRGEQLDS